MWLWSRPVALAEVRKRSRRSKSLPEMQKSHFSDQNFRNFPNASERFRTHPDASECIRTGPNRSEQVRTRPKTSKNVRTLQKIREKFAKMVEKNSRRLLFTYNFLRNVSTKLTQDDNDSTSVRDLFSKCFANFSRIF